jgi:thiamine phosphate synthase YjbQ (UPF0047 family)
MEHHDLDVDTSGGRLVDLTTEVAAFCRPLGDGLLNVFVPHATAGVALFERPATARTTCCRCWCRRR